MLKSRIFIGFHQNKYIIMIFKYVGTVRNGYGSAVGRSASGPTHILKKFAFANFLKNILNGTVRNGSVGSGRRSAVGHIYVTYLPRMSHICDITAPNVTYM